MALLIAPERWPERVEAARGPLAPLVDGLARELQPLLGPDVYIPSEKALLSREGGRCSVDGSLLEFDPFNPAEHRCGVCGRVYRGELHDRFWLYWYQLWLAERAVHAALLYRLGGDQTHAELARSILAGYADRYLHYPNRDNVLGPTRVFFSTYIESIWLLQLCVALDLLEESGPDAFGDTVRDRVIEPSSELIAVYNEGISNRQAWNNAALLAARVVLGRREEAASVVGGKGGLLTHLSRALLADGTWYEGENYHLFAHRGLWYCVTIADRIGVGLPPGLVARFQEGFATPLLTALPDLTLVSRRDSQYAISLRQVRFAELCELGLARARDQRLVDMLHTLYAPDVPRGDTGRWRATADVERNLPPVGLSRGDLSWRSLLHALPELPAAARGGARSVVLEGQGIAVLRRDRGHTYVALDYGHSGGGHGHPDRLNLLLADGATRWLDDMGTGAYVERTLFWYRSTLAHNTLLVDGRSQERVHGRLLAYEERGGAGWVDAAVDEIAPGVCARRTVVVMPDYLLDEISWTSSEQHVIDLPFHIDGELSGVSAWRSAPLSGGDAPEDGFEFVRASETSDAPAGTVVHLAATAAGKQLDAWFHAAAAAEWWRAIAPGPPGAGERRFHLARVRGGTGTLRSAWSWCGAVVGVAVHPDRIEVSLADGTRHVHSRKAHGWHVDFLANGARSSIDLGGARAQDAAPPSATVGVYGDATVSGLAAAPTRLTLARNATARFELGKEHYRRSEEAWEEAGRPSSTVTVSWSGTQLHVDARVRKGFPPLPAPADAVNRYDNEQPDINGDGIQLYVRTPTDGGAWVLVPEKDDTTVRVRPIVGWGTLAAPRASWRPEGEGYVVEATLPVARPPTADALTIAFDLIVNETRPGRERRRGQLVLSGASGEFVYLAGDRHDPDRMLELVLAP